MNINEHNVDYLPISTSHSLHCPLLTDPLFSNCFCKLVLVPTQTVVACLHLDDV